MSSETDVEFVERMRNDLDWDMPEDELDRLFALARRGAALENHGQDAKPSEETTPAYIWFPCCVCGSKYATRGEGTLPDGRWVCSRACEIQALPPLTTEASDDK